MENVRGSEHLLPFKHDNLQLLKTKSTMPLLCSDLLSRDRLTKKVNEAMNQRLTKLILLSAPASYGKSTVLADWASTYSLPVCWLTLDDEDNDEPQFWSYFIQSIPKLNSNVRKKILNMLLHSNVPNYKKIIMTIINELNAQEDIVTIILDNYHHIKNQSIDKHMSYFLMYLPTNVRIIISTRTIPKLPLSLMRAKGELVEIKTKDLRFSLTEEYEFFKKALDVSLSKEQITNLDNKIEGWICALKLVSQSIKNVIDNKQIVKEVKTNQKHIKDYFADEIILKQTEQLQMFLLKTSIFRTFHSTLCDYVIGSDNSQSTLEEIEDLNLFIVPLDEERNLYRYHYLFKESLYECLKKDYPDLLVNLHKKARSWYEKNDDLREAIYHSIKGKEYENAGKLIEKYTLRFSHLKDVAEVSEWIKEIPTEVIKRFPIIWIYQIKLMIYNGDFDKACAAFGELKSAMKTFSEDHNTESFKYEFLIIEAILSFIRGDKNVVRFYSEACDFLKNTGLKGYSFVTYKNNQASLLQSELGKKGNLNRAMDYYHDFISRMESSRVNLAPICHVNAMLSEIFYERNNLNEAMEYVTRVNKSGTSRSDFGLLAPVQIINSKVKLAEGDYYSALEVIKKVETKALELNYYDWLRIIRAQKTRIYMKSNEKEQINEWLDQCDLSVNGEIKIDKAFEFITYVRALMWKKDFDKGLLLLQRLLPTVEQEGGVGTLIEVYNLKALCLHNKKEQKKGNELLLKSVMLGANNGYYRLYLDEGEPMKKLLKQFNKNSESQMHKDVGSNKYVKKLLDGFPTEQKERSELGNRNRKTKNKDSQLTKRELEVLKQLCDGYSNQEIAERLFISVITVKVHLKHIYQKLGVKNRTNAILTANEQNLFH
ncbi:LuxR C-terminal-related transcriptional regulator [Evansella sp. AB-P1]|uniref:LuxR C-terminal-related transcriptional regulator n=1 Tax=Evansella sp. AB-P1 TaxID=3037653 RepID=UPI00241FE8E9|nr:LuxR C-terminal-related transcriptional regulator [Evansella sp. AB-P1]MDG5786027.1 LuxR C-terminal-related transcriptional regulator [Evansella sp. AB-P1]